MTVDEWLEIGIKNGWCSVSVCDTHEGLPMLEDEEKEFEEGGDPCIHAVRLWPRESYENPTP